MLSKTLVTALVALQGVSAFPWVPKVAGVDSTLLHARQQNPPKPASEKNCPYNPDHKGAAPFNPKYPYNYAKDGKPGRGKGGYKVPADGDTAHYFVPPDDKLDIRGPCPGINAMANHNFLSHDGITTFDELVDAQQNVYNVGFDLAQLLAVLGLTTTDGDIVTEKLSIGCDATNRTSFAPALTGQEPGLDGHNHFEADTSLSRTDYFLGKGDDFTFNGTIFGSMIKSTGGNFDRTHMAKYRYERYQQSLATNPHFYFGPLSLLLYGVSSFLYELFPSGTRDYAPDLYDVSAFYGAEKDKKTGEWVFNGKERLPDNWTNRVEPYSNMKVGKEILEQYLMHPVLFGGNTADGSFDVVDGPHGLIKDGKLSDAVDATVMTCLLYQLATERVPSSLNGFLQPTIKAIDFALTKLGPAYNNLGCPNPLS